MAKYQWNKYSAVKSYVYAESVSGALSTVTDSTDIKAAKSYIFNSTNGTFTLQNQKTFSFWEYKKAEYPYFAHNSKIYLVNDFRPAGLWTMTGYELISTRTERYSKGTLIGVVKSGSTTDYPANGLHSDGYWYEYIGEIRTVGKLKINGTLYDLTDEGYVKINGVLCPITSSLIKHNDTLKDLSIGG